jgi:hypothetical protein
MPGFGKSPSPEDAWGDRAATGSNGVRGRKAVPRAGGRGERISASARSLLIARPNGRWVQYEPVNGESEEPRHRLGAAVSAELKKGGKVAEKVFRLATAFTHPRRMEV